MSLDPHEGLLDHGIKYFLKGTGWFFNGSTLKVLSVEDGNSSTKKVKVKVSHRENWKF